MRNRRSLFLLLLTLIGGLLVALPSLPAHAQRFRGFTISPVPQEGDIEALATWNANLIRYNLYWGEAANTASEAEYFTWLNEKLERLSTVLAWAESRKLRVAITLYTPPGGFEPNLSPSLHRLFQESWARNAYISAWRKIVQRVKGHPAIWGYDLLNEPAIGRNLGNGSSWRVLARDAAKAMREVDPECLIIVQPPYGDQARLSALRTLKIPRIVISIHAYYPWAFVHQGLYGQPLGATYPAPRLNQAALAKNVRTARRFQMQRKVPIYVGEFTAVRWAPNDSAYKYLADLIPIFERYGWNWTYHSFREADYWSLEHSSQYGDSTRILGETNRARLVKAYLQRNTR